MNRDIRVVDKRSLDFIDHKVNGKVALAFAAVVPNGNDNFIEQGEPAKYNVFMTFRKGIKRTREERDPFHQSRVKKVDGVKIKEVMFLNFVK